MPHHPAPTRNRPPWLLASSASLCWLHCFTGVQAEGIAQCFRVAFASILGEVPWKAALTLTLNEADQCCDISAYGGNGLARSEL